MLHFEILIEDMSGSRMVAELLPRILPEEVTYALHAYKGMGELPQGIQPGTDASHRILLDRLPKILRGYGKAFVADAADYKRVVVVICDVDDRDLNQFHSQLQTALATCNPAPWTIFCLVVEEGEAWLLSDTEAVVAAYPKADRAELAKYTPDTIVGTWERLADAVYPGGSKALVKLGYQEIGRMKYEWAAKISPNLDIANNPSPSFRGFVADMSGIVAQCDVANAP